MLFISVMPVRTRSDPTSPSGGSLELIDMIDEVESRVEPERRCKAGCVVTLGVVVVFIAAFILGLATGILDFLCLFCRLRLYLLSCFDLFIAHNSDQYVECTSHVNFGKVWELARSTSARYGDMICFSIHIPVKK